MEILKRFSNWILHHHFWFIYILWRIRFRIIVFRFSVFIKYTTFWGLIVFGNELEHGWFNIPPMKHLPVLTGPCIGTIEVGIFGKEMFHEGLRLTSSLELFVKSECKEIARADFDSFIFFVDYHLHYFGLKTWKETRRHLKFQFKLIHGFWHEIVVTLLVQQL